MAYTLLDDEPVTQSLPAARPKFTLLEDIDPTEGMTTGELLAAGAGSAVNRAGLGVKQALDAGSSYLEEKLGNTFIGRGIDAFGEKLGMPSVAAASAETNQAIEEAKRLDAPLLNTTAGQAGNIAGNLAMFAPTAFIPGANTVTGAATIGAIGGALSTPGGLDERGMAAVIGGGGGVAGKLAGDKIAGSLAKGKQARATRQSANKVMDETLAAARGEGYVVPPVQVNPTLTNRTLEGFAGKLSTGQSASLKNQSVTNRLARESLGLSPEAPLTKETLGGLRAEAGKAYEAIRNVGSFKADKEFAREVQNLGRGHAELSKEFPELANSEIATLTSALNKAEISSGSAVELIKKLRFDGSANRAVQDPAKRALGQAQGDAADAIEDLIERNLFMQGRDGLVMDFREARTLIAKTYSVEQALNPATGNVIASKLGKQLAKNKPLSGGLETAAGFSQAFPKAAQEVTSSMPGVSPLDYFGGGTLSALTGNPWAMASVAARPAIRSTILSKPYQRLMATPDYSSGVIADLVSPVISSKLARGTLRALPLSGRSTYAAKE